MKHCIILTLLICMVFVAGCEEYGPTTKAENVKAEYVSSEDYSIYSYDKLVQMHHELSRREKALIIAQEERLQASKKQELWLGVGKGDGVETAELARVRGEKQAIMEALQLKKMQPGV